MHALKTYIVEDSPVIRESLVALLEESVPVEVVGTAEDELTALDWIDHRGAHDDCDLVIVDIYLKGGSGLGVLKAGAGVYKPAKWVVFSNHATPEMRNRCLELGADCVFDKSNEIDELLLYCNRLASNDEVPLEAPTAPSVSEATETAPGASPSPTAGLA
ncbi:response regulator transcription factor [Piscinibacter gummiphilus]|uniref:Response regulator transcription factor n=1 Tax=Piscinibacter gummiphilus TaxID=946333 RepID=A0ABZ0D053_9BURK|nr:response regulator transcription factor [Piscinibacter gummiphilus]WOB08129.1 response regulator transcription factor [Piscinibacter gummiphilus]